MPKVSVIIPVYNTEDYLKRCIDSLINQTLADIEIICVDDGSTDNSIQILKEYNKNDERIIIIQQENSGAAVARNKGIDAAKGDYFYFIDSDDYVDRTLLEKMYNQANDTDSDICICKRSDYDESRNKLNVVEDSIIIQLLPSTVFNVDEIKNNIFQFCSISIFNKIFKKELIQNNNIRFQNLSSCNDVFFYFITLALATQITYIDESLMTSVRCRKGSITSSRGNKINNIILAGEYTKDNLQKLGLFDKVKKSFFNRIVDCCFYEISQCNDIEVRKEFNRKVTKFLPIQYLFVYKMLCLNVLLKKILAFIFSIKNFYENDVKHKMITILGIKIKTKRKNNYIYIVDENNDYIKVKRLKGLKIKFNGSNNTVIIHKTVKFNKCKMLLNSNDKIEIASNNGFGIENVLFWISSNNCTVQIGENTSMHGGTLHLRNKPNTKIIIGNNCLFSSDVIIRTSDGHSIYDIDTKELLNQDEDVIINDNVWICNGVKILKGAQIPSNCVIATGAIITKKLKRENCIYANVNHIVKENIMWSNISPHEYRKGNIK